MTIIAAAVAPDGLVLVADGRTTAVNGRRHRIASDHTRKVFAPFPGIGVATYGAALLVGRTIAGHMEEFVTQRQKIVAATGENVVTTIDDVSQGIADHFGPLLEEEAELVRRKPPPGVLGFLVAGYGADGVGRVYDVLLPPVADAPGPVIKHEDPSTRLPGHLYRGQTPHARRLFEGYDIDALARSGVTPDPTVEQELKRFQYHINQPLSQQEAIDLAVFIVRLTIDMDRLSDGTFADPEAMPLCGGAMQVLMITSQGYSWVVQPQLRVSRAGIAEAG
jgi:hypothetical protein